MSCASRVDLLELVSVMHCPSLRVAELADFCASDVSPDEDGEYRAMLSRRYRPIEEDCRRLAAKLFAMQEGGLS